MINSMSQIEARPAIVRQSVHSSITAAQISDLVDRFYSRVGQHALLNPIFQNNTNGNWDDHLEKMKSFWRSVLLRTGEYKGKPVPVHLKIQNIDTAEFSEWLKLFSTTAHEVMTREAAELVEAAAQRIATSLWLSRSSDPFVSPPDWSATPVDPAT